MGGERAFAFLRLNEREQKPRPRGLTEIRGPYYTAMGTHYLADVLETMAPTSTRSRTPAAPSAMPRSVVQELNELCHRHDVEVSTGGFLEYVLT